ncbi:MAG: hypothetical protein CL946_05295 [Ectothiorhodospiraceae bacterium]|nr:hypothetical protein [Ectothiorhodospiraceae bacterium]
MKSSLSKARVGLLIFVGVLTFVLGLFYVGEKNQLFKTTHEIYANFPSAEGVKNGSIVVLSGYNIGVVSGIDLTGEADSIRLTLKISEEVMPFIKVNSEAQIKQEGLVGNMLINITGGTDNAPAVEPGGYIQGKPPFALTSLADNVASIMDSTKVLTGELAHMAKGINEGQGSIGALMTERDMYDNMLSITERTDEALRLTNEQIREISKVLKDVSLAVNGLVVSADTAVQNLNSVTEQTDILLRKLNRGEGTLGALMSDRALYDSLATLVSALSDVTYDASNVTNQTAQSIHAMRSHWLLGRFMGGDEFDEEQPPESSYQQKLKELDRLRSELESRMERIREREKELGITPSE